jgi:hypothetical protein
MTAALVKASATTATLSLGGNAASHVDADDVANLVATFTDSAFTGGSAAAIRNSVRNSLAIDFNDAVPTFSVTETSGVVTFGGTATGNITVSVTSGGVATFTRQGLVAETRPDLDTLTKITVTSGQTLTASAAILDGLVIDGAGAVAVHDLQARLAADLSAITATTVTAAFADNGTFTGTLGTAAVTVAAGKTLTLSAAAASGKTIAGAGNTVITNLAVATEYALAAVTSSAGAVSATLTTGGTLHAETTLNNAIALMLANTTTLTGTADQLHGVTLVDGSGTGNVVVTSLGSATFDASGINLGGTLSYNLADADVTLADDTILAPTAAASVTINIGDGNTLSASAAQLNGMTVTASGSGKVNISGAAGDQHIVGTSGDDTLAGGAGNDELDGGAGDDSYVFAEDGASNGNDTIVFVPSDDLMDFAAFLPNGSVVLDVAALAVTDDAEGNANADNSLLGLDDGSAAPTLSALAALFSTTDNVGDNYFVLGDGGKAIVIHGDAGSATRVATIYFVDAALDGTGTDLSADDIVIVGTTSASIDLATLMAGNFNLAA